MPLKLIPPRKSPFFSVRGTYLGVYVDRSTKAGKRAIAAKVLRQWEREIECGEFTERSEQTFASAAAAYMTAGGEGIYLRRLLEHFGEKPLKQIDQAEIDAAAIALYPMASPATRNRQIYTPMSAILRHVGRKLDLRRPKGSGGNKQTAWLWPEQAFRLFDVAEKLNHRFAALLMFLCYTELRWSEALGMTWDRVRLADGFAYIPDTKTDEPRAVFLPPVVVAALANLGGGDTGRVFAFCKSGHLYHLLRSAAFKS